MYKDISEITTFVKMGNFASVSRVIWPIINQSDIR